MKKVFALVLALALALSLAVMSSAAAADDLRAVLEDLYATVGADNLKAAFEEAWADVAKKLDIPKADATDAGKLPAETGNEVAGALIDKLGIVDTDIAAKIQGAMSNDFVSFLCGLYTGECPPVTGDITGSVVAIASAAALVAVLGAVLVIKKKKDGKDD
ncbi:MAG: LPXTG cell wall anchor domain-containing protein [Oscillospiraceae bacterium]|nr:LPXTG cell wall anchor domain-containing protein [Oscillospiraceae bacterium]